MIVQKLFSSERKKLTQKQPYKKPVYKSYKELLQLDRPKKNISYQSQSSEEDFLEKLLKEEKKRSKSKKKTSRRNTSRNEKRSRGENRPTVNVVHKKNEEEEEKKKPKPKVMNEIQLFLAQTKELEGSSDKNPQKEEAHQQKPKQLKKVKSKSTTRIRPHQTSEKSKPTQPDILLSNPIFIDTKSIETPPIFYTSASKMLSSTLPSKQNSAYRQLLAQKQRYTEQFRQTPSLKSHINQEKVEHSLKNDLNNNFSFNPNTQPLYSNWRVHLTFNPLQHKQHREFKDRKTLFKNDEEENRFVRSLRQLSMLKT